MIYHWCPRSQWEATNETYLPAEFADDGFVHCSFLDQVASTASNLDRGRTDLVLLCIDENGLSIKTEDRYQTGEAFPHIYQAIPAASVVAVVEFPCDRNGGFTLPPSLAT